MPARRLLAVAAVLGALLVLPATYPAGAHRWPTPTITYWADDAARPAAALAAARWNAAGLDVRFVPAARRAAAEVVIRTSDRALERVCGEDCLGWKSAVGEPRRGRTTVTLGAAVAEPVRPLSVWVAAHELGHVLGLEHRSPRTCTLMKPRAFVGRCTPPAATPGGLSRQLRCIPASADVRAAERLYGRARGAARRTAPAAGC